MLNNKKLGILKAKVQLTLKQKSKSMIIILNYFNVQLKGKLDPKPYPDFLLVLDYAYS